MHHTTRHNSIDLTDASHSSAQYRDLTDASHSSAQYRDLTDAYTPQHSIDLTDASHSTAGQGEQDNRPPWYQTKNVVVYVSQQYDSTIIVSIVSILTGI